MRKSFDEWLQGWKDMQPSGKLSYDTEQGALEAWDHQQERIDRLESVIGTCIELIDKDEHTSAMAISVSEILESALQEDKG